MKFTKIAYSRTFPMEQYANEKPFVEIELQEGESPLHALQEAKRFVEEFHELNIKEREAKNVKDISEELPKSHKGIIEQILSCKTMPELREWEIYVNSKNGQPLKGIYEQREKQIKNGN